MRQAAIIDIGTWTARSRIPVPRRSFGLLLPLAVAVLLLPLPACRTEETKKAEATPKVVVHAEPIQPADGSDVSGSGIGAKPSASVVSPSASVRGASGVSGPGSAWSDVSGSGIGAKPSASVVSPSASVRGASGVSGPGSAWSDGLLPDFASIYERAAPSVVKVQTFRTGGGEPFAMGTGFFFGKPGEIITNAHVVRDGASFTVTTADGQERQATLVGADGHTDIALLQVEGENLPRALPAAEPGLLRTGDWVLAIGNPLGLDFSASRGIVSALNRTDVLPDSLGYWDFIQTDAAINLGNSGGPLLNHAGAVVGIAAAVEKQADRIGFAIPISTAETVAEHLRRFGVLKRAWLGIEIVEVKGQIQVYGVRPDSPAGKAGFRPGDVILSLDDIPVSDRPRFRWQVATHSLDAPVRFRILRDGKEDVVTVQLEAAPDLRAQVR